MGRGRNGTGVELRPKSIRVHFTWNGTRCRETLEDTAPTVPNRKAAERMMAEINRLLDVGRFTIEDYAKHFPGSKRALALTRATQSDQTFGAFCKLYLAKRSDLAKATWTGYRNELIRWRARIGEHRLMAEIKPSWLAAEVGKVEFPGASMRNNSLIPLRGVFALWVADSPRERDNPMDGIDNVTVQQKKPDPFEREEAELITAHILKRYGVEVWAYFEFAFFAGVRPEEAIALLWEKIDWRRSRVLIDRARTFHGVEKSIKTNVARWVDLNSRAIAALKAMRAITQMKSHKHVFEDPRHHEPWVDERIQRVNYWYPTIQRLQLRPRPPYSTRSTRATMMLMAGMNPAYCARQLGHSKREFFDTYADWIDDAIQQNDRERAKDEAEIRPRKDTAAG